MALVLPKLKSVKIIFWIMKVFGILPRKNASKAYKIYGYIIQFIFCIVFDLAMGISAFTFENIDEFTQQWYITLTGVTYMFKVFNSWKKYEKYAELLEYIATLDLKNEKDYDDYDENDLIKLKKLDRFLLCYVYSTFLGILTISVSPLFSSPYRLPVFTWFYGINYGKDYLINYYILCIYQILGITLQAFCNVALDSSICYMMLIAECQFSDLGQKLQLQTNDTSDDDKVLKQFAENINYYESILKQVLLNIINHISYIL